MSNIFRTCFLIAFCVLYGSGYTQTRHALVIGIDNYYFTKSIVDAGHSLHGCVNDARSVKALLITRFGFKEAEITELYNDKATKSNIETALQQLLAGSKQGDVAFIYYSGHGILINNSYSDKDNGHNQGIVTSDVYQAGTSVIRDNYLKALFNKFIDKKVILTTVFDCCYGGSLARAPWGQYLTHEPRFNARGIDRRVIESVVAEPDTAMETGKSLPFTDIDYKDSIKVQPPADRAGSKFIAFAAATGMQEGGEIIDESNNYHGIFTKALIDVFKKNSAAINCNDLFKKINTEIQQQGFTGQTPVINAAPVRLTGNFLGCSSFTFKDGVKATCTKKAGDSVFINMGIDEGLMQGNILEDITFYKKVFVQVKKLVGNNAAIATVVKGDKKKVNPGNVFKVTDWYTTSSPVIKVYIPNDPYTTGDFNTLFTNTVTPLLTASTWDYGHFKLGTCVMFFLNNKNVSAWDIDKDDAVALKKLDIAAVEEYAGNRPYFIFLPIPQYISAAVKTELGKDQNILVVDDPSKADYCLYCNYSKTAERGFIFTFSEPINKKHFANGGFLFDINHAKTASITLTQQQLNTLSSSIRTMALNLARGSTKNWFNSYPAR